MPDPSTPVVAEVLWFEDLPPGSLASRRVLCAGAMDLKARPRAVRRRGSFDRA